MSIPEITCELVDEGDQDTRYLAGQLSPEGAEAFEAHFFGCERCWALVQQGLAVRSAFGAEAPAPELVSAQRVPKKVRGLWWGLAAAASIAVAVVGIWRLGTPQPESAEDVFRGKADSFTVAATANPAGLGAAWKRQADADAYRIRLYRADGSLVLERETADTSISVPVDSISATRGAQLYWQVQALDRLRSLVAASELTGTRLLPSAP